MKSQSKHKDRRIDWIGKIPKHWTIKRSKYVFDPKKGKRPEKLKSEKTKESVPYLSMNYLRTDNDIADHYCHIDDGLTVAKENDIILLWDGDNTGEVIRSKSGVVSSTMARMDVISSDSFG